MSYTDIVKVYSPPVVDGTLAFITNDMPIRWSIRICNGKECCIVRTGQDKDVNLEECQTWVTIKSSSEDFSGVIGPIPPGGQSHPVQRTTYDSVEVKIRVKNDSLSEIPFDFKTSNAKHDRVLIIQGEKFYIQSAYLSTWSSYFDRMFNGEFVEKEKNEIEIKDVNPVEFEELLRVIYPTRKNIDNTNVVSLWKLADRFDIPSVVQLCERYVTTTPGFYMLSFWEKYDLATSMKCEKLEKMCRETKVTNDK